MRSSNAINIVRFDCCAKQLKPGLSLMTDLIARAMKDKSRPGRDIARDVRDNTSKVLSFAGVKPKQFVVDFLPFRGYYTRLFASMVGDAADFSQGVRNCREDVPFLANHRCKQPGVITAKR
jgi:predicted methyltransferase